MEKLRRGNEVRVRRDKVAVIGRGAFVRTFCHCLSFFFLFFILSLPLSSTMQSSLLLRARAPVSSPRSVTTPKRSAAVMPLAATAVPTEVIFIYFPPPHLSGFRRLIREIGRNAPRSGLLLDALIGPVPLEQSTNIEQWPSLFERLSSVLASASEM